MKPVDPLLTGREAAAELNVSVATLYRLVAAGTLPKQIKLGACARWPRSEILAAIKAAGDRRQA